MAAPLKTASAPGMDGSSQTGVFDMACFSQHPEATSLQQKERPPKRLPEQIERIVPSAWTFTTRAKILEECHDKEARRRSKWWRRRSLIDLRPIGGRDG